VVFTAGAGRWQVTVRVCHPATLLKATRAFNLLAKQCSYSAVKSAADTAGCCLGQVVSPACDPRVPLAKSAHVGEPGEVEGWGVGRVSWREAGQAGWPATPQVGEARWRGPGWVTVLLWSLPRPQHGGGGGRWQVKRQCKGEENLPRRGLAAD
jgi:hypothetical protein